MRPPNTQVTAVPAMIPLGAADPRLTIGGGGATAITFTVAAPEIVPEVAVTVLRNVPVTAPAVNTPVFGFTLPPPFATVQIGFTGITLPPASRAIAVNSC